MISKIKEFFERKRYWYFLPKKIRFLIWNIKILKKYKTKNGDYYLPFFAFKDGIRNRIINNEITDKLIFDKLKDLIKPDTIVLDLGANFGQMSILWSKCKPGVEVHEVGLGNISTTLHFVDSEDNCGNAHIVNKKKKHSYEIEVRKLDDEHLQECNLIKIDVQGYDLDALKGSKKTILNHKMPIIFEYEEKFEKEFNYTFRDFENFINEINYKIETKIDEINYLIVPK